MSLPYDGRKPEPPYGCPDCASLQAVLAEVERERDTYKKEHRTAYESAQDLEKRCSQLSLNTSWLISQIDKICSVVCPSYVGTWQQRAQQASFEVYQLSSVTLTALQAKLEATERERDRDIREAGDDMMSECNEKIEAQQRAKRAEDERDTLRADLAECERRMNELYDADEVPSVRGREG